MSRDKRTENGVVDKEKRGRGSYPQPPPRGHRDRAPEKVIFDYLQVFFKVQPATVEREEKLEVQKKFKFLIDIF